MEGLTFRPFVVDSSYHYGPGGVIIVWILIISTEILWRSGNILQGTALYIGVYRVI